MINSNSWEINLNIMYQMIEQSFKKDNKGRYENKYWILYNSNLNYGSLQRSFNGVWELRQYLKTHS